MFQYPLADRVGFWGVKAILLSPARARFSILLRIELVFGVSLASLAGLSPLLFQYPLADRVGFWGRWRKVWRVVIVCFSILLRIELVFGANSTEPVLRARPGFSILLRIELVFGGR